MIKLITLTILLISFSGQSCASAGNNFAIGGEACQFKGTIKADSVGNFFFCGPNFFWSPSPLSAKVVAAQKRADAAYALAKKAANAPLAPTVVDAVRIGCVATCPSAHPTVISNTRFLCNTYNGTGWITIAFKCM